MNKQIKQTLLDGYSLFTESSFLLSPCLKKAQAQALQSPKLALTLVSIASVVLGFLRMVTYPILCVGIIISFPFIALVKKCHHESAGKWFVAWALSLLTLALIISSIVSIILFAPVPMLFIAFATTILISVSATCIQINNALYKKN